jgi:hypothetical protein
MTSLFFESKPISPTKFDQFNGYWQEVQENQKGQKDQKLKLTKTWQLHS